MNGCLVPAGANLSRGAHRLDEEGIVYEIDIFGQSQLEMGE